MGCYLKGKVGTEMGSEMKGNVCAEGNFCLSEVIFLPFQEEFKQSFFCVISKYNFGRRRCQMRGMQKTKHKAQNFRLTYLEWGPKQQEFFPPNIVKYQGCTDILSYSQNSFSELRMACFLIEVESQDVCQDVLLNVLCFSKVQ